MHDADVCAQADSMLAYELQKECTQLHQKLVSIQSLQLLQSTLAAVQPCKAPSAF